MANRSYAGSVAPEGIFLDERMITTDAGGQVRYIDGRQLARSVRGIVKVNWPREGESLTQFIAGLVDVGQLAPEALILGSYFTPGQPGEIHWVIVDKGN